MHIGEELTCAQTVHFLFRYLDGDLGEVEEMLVNAHLDHCHRCARKVRFERRVIDGLRSRLQAVRAPEDLKRRIGDLLERI